MEISKEAATRQFEEFMHNSNARPHDASMRAIGDGKIHRYRVEGDAVSSKNGAYVLHLDGRPAGYVMSWKDGFEERENWKYQLSKEERRAYAREMNTAQKDFGKPETPKEKRVSASTEQVKAQTQPNRPQVNPKLTEQALNEYISTPEGNIFTHPYLKKKFPTLSYVDDGQFNYDGVRNFPPKVCTHGQGGIWSGSLLVPMRNVRTGAFQTMIQIPAHPNADGRWTKYNYSGLPTTGSAYIIRPLHATNKVIYVCEGFATAIALMLDTESKFIILAAGSCHNLKAVCEGLHSKTDIVLVADHDEAGLKAAEECRKLVRQVKTPDGNGLDWYDYYMEKKGW